MDQTTTLRFEYGLFSFIEYEGIKKTLRVRVRDGGEYKYEEVPLKVFQAFTNAPTLLAVNVKAEIITLSRNPFTVVLSIRENTCRDCSGSRGAVAPESTENLSPLTELAGLVKTT